MEVTRVQIVAPSVGLARSTLKESNLHGEAALSMTATRTNVVAAIKCFVVQIPAMRK